MVPACSPMPPPRAAAAAGAGAGVRSGGARRCSISGPGTEAMEREACSTCSASPSSGHPDLTRILMPEDWEGHPLRKDVRPCRPIPVQFKGRTSRPMSEVAWHEQATSHMGTGPDGSGAAGARRTAARHQRRAAPQRGRRPRCCEWPKWSADDPLDPASIADQRMILNMGPSHPSTHGVLRLMLEMEGETVLRSKPVIGYLHTGMEKTAEDGSPTCRAAPTSPAWTTPHRCSTSWPSHGRRAAPGARGARHGPPGSAC